MEHMRSGGREPARLRLRVLRRAFLTAGGAAAGSAAGWTDTPSIAQGLAVIAASLLVALVGYEIDSSEVSVSGKKILAKC